MKVVLAVSSVYGDRRALALCERAASADGRHLFAATILVDSLADGSIGDWIRDRGLDDFIHYENSSENLGSAGNLARRLALGVELGADYLFAVNHDGDLRLAVVEALVARARETPCAAVYPLSELAPGLFDLTGVQPFPLRPVRRRVEELPDRGLIDVHWYCSNGALYSLAPPRQGLTPPTGLWHGQEDLAYGLILARAGHRQVVDLSCRIEMRYEMRPVNALGRTRLVSDKRPWLAYYFARNLLLVALDYAPRASFVARALARIALEAATTLAFRRDKRTRLRLLARGTLDGLRRRTGMTVTPPEPAPDAPAATATATATTAAPSVVYAVTSPLTADLLLRGQLARVAAAGFRVTVVSAPGPGLDAAARREGVDAAAVPMRREIAPLADLVALARLYRLLRRLRPAIVNASTPKAGLLALLAARAARVPARIYVLRGLRLETTHGLKRRILMTAERLAARAAHRVLAVSPSLARRYRELGLGPRDKITVLATGSSNGVRRPPENHAGGRGERLRRELGLDDAPVVGFVGRLTRDKGAADLVAAFAEVSRGVPAARLLVVGDFEPGDPVERTVAAALCSDARVTITGFVDDPWPYYEAMSVLAFPSHREGFPNAPLEAALAGRPTVGYAVTGTVDAVVDGVTGRLVPLGDRTALAAEIRRYLERPDLAAAHGAAASARAATEFRPERLWDELIELYRAVLGDAGIAPPPTNRHGDAA